jgi:plastocyanin
MFLLGIGGLAAAQTVMVTGRAQVVRPPGSAAGDAAEVVVWLTPLDASPPPLPAIEAQHLALVQSGKHFEPHILVVPVGAAVQFPNKDPFFHNVFSLFEGKRFDLGLYEAGSTRTVRFDKPGVSYIFCNIHPQMSAVVIAVPTPFYGISARSGAIAINDVPAGRYRLNVWYEASNAADLARMAREISISAASHSLGLIHVTDAGLMQASHKNKYGRDYDDPVPTTPGYSP